jgi:hypothetical protein
MTGWARRLVLLTLAGALAACGAVRVQPEPNVPQPLLDKLPVTLGLYYPKEFREYVHREKRYGQEYEVSLGPAHVSRLDRLFGYMFERIVPVEGIDAIRLVQPPLTMALVPHLDEYAFITPRDTTGETFAVTIRYHFDLFDGQGRLVDSYTLTGYGNAPSGSMSSTTPLVVATQRAMRDAGAKLAVELPEQDTVRRLLRGETVETMGPAVQDTATILGTFEGSEQPAGGAAAAPAPATAATPAAPPGSPPATAAQQPGATPPEAGATAPVAPEKPPEASATAPLAPATPPEPAPEATPDESPAATPSPPKP